MNRILDSQARPLVIASQLGSDIDGALARQVSNLAFIDVEHGIFDWRATDAEVVLAAPVRDSAIHASTTRPGVWPGAIRWIQLISAGADSYPQWIFNGPLVTCARGPSARPIAEFVMTTSR